MTTKMLEPKNIPAVRLLLARYEQMMVDAIKSLEPWVVLEHLFLHTKATTIDELADEGVTKYLLTSRHTRLGTVLDHVVTETAMCREDWDVLRPDADPKLKVRYKGVDNIFKQGGVWFIVSCKMSRNTQNGSGAGAHWNELRVATEHAKEDGAERVLPMVAYLGQDPVGGAWLAVKNGRVIKSTLDRSTILSYHEIYGRALFTFITGNPYFWEQLHELMRNQEKVYGLQKTVKLKISQVRKWLQDRHYCDNEGRVLWDRIFAANEPDFNTQMAEIRDTFGAPTLVAPPAPEYGIELMSELPEE